MTVHHPEIIISRSWNNKFVAASKCWKLHLAFPFSNAVVELLGKILLHATGIQVSWFQIQLYNIYIYNIYTSCWGICMHLRPTKIAMFQGRQEKALDYWTRVIWVPCTHIYIYTSLTMLNLYIYIHTWNLFVLYFGVWTLQKKAFSNQNRGHLSSVCIYIYMYIF